MNIFPSARATRGLWIGALLLLPWLGPALPAHAATEPAAAAAAATDKTDKTDKSDRLAELERKLDQSLELIRKLSARVQELEAAQAQATRSEAAHAAAPPASPGTAAAAASASGPAATPADTAARLAQVERTVSEIATGAAQRAEDVGMPMHGFADVGVGNHHAEFHEYRGADVGELDFFLTPRLGARTRALFELNFEVGESGQVGVDLERAQIGYQIGDSATLWLGRFHTPYGYYNTAFHHGQQIAISLRRPRFIEFEDHGGIMPAHTVGLWLTGAERLSDEKLTYDVYVGNSQSISGGELDMHNAGNLHGSAIFGGNLGLLPGGALDGLKVGIDAFQTRIEDEDLAPSIFTRVRSYGVYAAYDTDSWENIAEFHVFDDTDLTGGGGTRRSEAGFVQVAYRGRFTPYVRYERGSFQQADNYFAAQTYGASYYRNALGVRYDIDLQSALKFELADTHITDRDVGSFGDVLLQYAIRF